MKKYLFLIFIISQAAICQNRYFEKALIYNDKLIFLEEVNKGRFLENNLIGPSAYLRIFNSNQNHNAIFSYLYIISESPKYNFPLTWDIYNNFVYPIGFSEGSERTFPRFGVFKVPLILEDTFEVVKKNKNEKEQLVKAYPNEDDRNKEILRRLDVEAQESREREVLPLTLLIKNLEGDDRNSKATKSFISYDLLILNEEKVQFFIRGINTFSIWILDVTKNHWKEAITYSSDSINRFQGVSSSVREFLPSPENTVYRSVNDSAFFQGRIRVIKQGENLFVINCKSGNIYSVLPNTILKVGQIQIKESKITLNGKRMFIEDRDNAELILFAKVDRVKEEFPFPKIKIIKSNAEFHKRFKNIKM